MPTFALNHSDYRSLGVLIGSRCATWVALAASPVVGLVHLYAALAAAAKLPRIAFVQHRANLLKHAPCSFIGYARLTLNLFGRNSATGRSHQVDRIKPSAQWRGRLVKDRASGRMNMVATMVARVRWAALNTMMFCGRFALDTVNAIRVEVITQPLKAGRVIRVLALKVFQCVRQHFRFAIVVSHEITYV